MFALKPPVEPGEEFSALSALVSSDGWRIVEAFLSAQLEHQVALVSAEADPNKLLRLAGAVHVLALLRGWPRQRLRELEAKLTAKGAR